MKKYKLKPAAYVLITVVLIAFVVVVALLIPKDDKSEPQVNIGVISGNSQQLETEMQTADNKENITVDIDSDDMTLVVGESAKITATVEPSTATVIWKSSDESIMTVTSDGIISGKKTGMAALTATVGNVSKAIVINWIEKENDVNTGGQENTGGTGNSGNNGSSSTGGSNGGTGNSGNSGSSSTGGSSGDTGNSGNNGGSNTGGNTSGSNGNSGNSGNTDVTVPGTPTEKPTERPTEKPTERPTERPTEEPTESEGLLSTQLYGILEGLGFKRHISNVYAYEDNGNYCGEVIIESDVAIIYIKQRTEGFDGNIIEILNNLLPGYSAKVWNNYLNSYADNTFMVGTRRVRIVKAVAGGHSQIVVYN